MSNKSVLYYACLFFIEASFIKLVHYKTINKTKIARKATY